MSKISGYRELTEAEIFVINRIKETANEVGKQIEVLRASPEVDQRWLSIAQTTLQQGFMFLVRAVAKPEGF